MSTHLITDPTTDPATPAAPVTDPAWLALSAAMTDEVPVIADRDDLLVTIAPGCRAGRPGVFPADPGPDRGQRPPPRRGGPRHRHPAPARGLGPLRARVGPAGARVRARRALGLGATPGRATGRGRGGRGARGVPYRGRAGRTAPGRPALVARLGHPPDPRRVRADRPHPHPRREPRGRRTGRRAPARPGRGRDPQPGRGRAGRPGRHRRPRRGHPRHAARDLDHRAHHPGLRRRDDDRPWPPVVRRARRRPRHRTGDGPGRLTRLHW